MSRSTASAMVVEVFKTSVKDETQAKELISVLLHHFPESRINFDLQDCDKILRMEGADFSTSKVVQLVNNQGITCSILE